MTLKRCIAAVVIAGGLVCLGNSAAAQSEARFKARLSPVPIDATMRANVKGGGSLTAVLVGTKLTITGSFDGLTGPATVARVHNSLATGVRGSPFHDLTVSKAASGTVTGTFDLTPEQVDSLRKGKVYVQIHSEKAPDGNLWGWLLR
jgi:hypothetical protein